MQDAINPLNFNIKVETFILLCTQLSFCNTLLSPSSAVSTFSSSSFSFPHPLFFYSFHSIYWSDEVTSWIPWGRPRTSGASPGGGWVKCRCGGWFPLMKYQYVTLVIYSCLTKHDTILSKLGNVYICLCSFSFLVMTKSNKTELKENGLLRAYSVLQRQRAVKEKLSNPFILYILRLIIRK